MFTFVTKQQNQISDFRATGNSVSESDTHHNKHSNPRHSHSFGSRISFQFKNHMMMWIIVTMLFQGTVPSSLDILSCQWSILSCACSDYHWGITAVKREAPKTLPQRASNAICSGNRSYTFVTPVSSFSPDRSNLNLSSWNILKNTRC